MNPKDDRLDRFETFLISHGDGSDDETLKELKSRGVRTTEFLSRVRRSVQDGYSRELRRLMETEQAASASDDGFVARLASMSREALLGLFESLRSGAYGAEYREAALARCRNSAAADLSDDELRSWLEDVGDIFGEPTG